MSEQDNLIASDQTVTLSSRPLLVDLPEVVTLAREAREGSWIATKQLNAIMAIANQWSESHLTNRFSLETVAGAFELLQRAAPQVTPFASFHRSGLKATDAEKLLAATILTSESAFENNENLRIAVEHLILASRSPGLTGYQPDDTPVPNNPDDLFEALYQEFDLEALVRELLEQTQRNSPWIVYVLLSSKLISKKHACSGDKVTIKAPNQGWPDSASLEKVSVPVTRFYLPGTYSGEPQWESIAFEFDQQDQTVTFTVPDFAITGDVLLDFKLPLPHTIVILQTEIPINPERMIVAVPFGGGRTVVNEPQLTSTEYESRLWPHYLSGDTVNIILSGSNIHRYSVKITDSEGVEALSQEIEPRVSSIDVEGQLPSLRDLPLAPQVSLADWPAEISWTIPDVLHSHCSLFHIEVTARDSCNGSTKKRTKSIVVEGSDTYLSSRDGTCPYVSRRVQGYYLHRSRGREAKVFEPRALAEIRAAIRITESADVDQANRLGPKSTGCSFHDITLPNVAAPVLETYFLTNRYWPGAQPPNNLSNPGGDVGYPARISKQAEVIAKDSNLLRPLYLADPPEPIFSDIRFTNVQRLSSRLSRAAIKAYEDSPASISNMPKVSERLFYVNAASKIGDLEAALFELGVALPTRGAAGHQSLAGAIATGTHGATMHLPPTSDLVRAVHLIGPGGITWWVEPSDERRITTSKFDGHPLPDFDIHDSSRECARVIRDNDLFDSLLVSMGVAGVIIGYVFETVPVHGMRREVNSDPVKWSEVKEKIQSTVLDANGPDLSTWFFAPTVASNGLAWIDKQWLAEDPPPPPSVPVPVGGLSGGASPKDFGIFSLATAFGSLALGGLVASEVAALGGKLGLAIALGPFGIALASDIKEQIARLKRLAKLLAKAAKLVDYDDSRKQAEAAAAALNSAFELGDGVPGLHEALIAAVDEFHQSYVKGELIDDRAAHGWSHQIIGKSSPGYPDRETGEKVDIPRWLAYSHEYAVDAAAVIPIVDQLLAFAQDQRRRKIACIFQMNIRYTQKSTGLAAQQRWPLTGHIEVFSAPELRGTSALYRELDRLANQYGAVPHWGQKRESFNQRLLPNLNTWRRKIESMAESNDGEFRKTFGSDHIRADTSLWSDGNL